MAGTDLASVDAIFKRNYNEGSDVLIKQQNLKAPMWGKWPKSPLKPSPQGIYNPVTMQGNENGGAINEEESFQAPASLTPVQPVIKAKLVVWPFQVTGSVIRQSETDKVAFAKGLDAQQQDNLGRMYNDLNRQSYGTGSGQIALTTNATTSVTVPVSDVFNFRAGMLIDSYASIGGTKEIDGVNIASVNYSASTLTLSASSTWSLGSIIVKKGVQANAPTDGKELTGWRAICDTTTYSTTFEGVSTSTYSQWEGNVVSASSAPVSQDLLQKTYNQGAVIGGETADRLISNYGQPRTFLNTELNKTRYEGGTVAAGNTVLKWGPLEWLVDHTYPTAEIGMMVTSGIEKFQTKDVGLSDLPGQSLYQVQGKDAIGGYYVYQGNLGTWKRNNQCRLISLTEPTF